MILGVRLLIGNKVIYVYFIDMEFGNFVVWDVLVFKIKFLIEKGVVIIIGEIMGVLGGYKKKREEVEIIFIVDFICFFFLLGFLLFYKYLVFLIGWWF